MDRDWSDVREERLRQKGTVVLIDRAHRFGQDALLLAQFSGVRRDWSLLDLGTGTGILPLALYDSGYAGECTALELSAQAAALAECAARRNGLDRLRVLCADLRTYTGERRVDAVLCNPPYFPLGSGYRSGSPERLAARHEQSCTLADIAAAATRNLKEGGRLCLCYRPERLAALCSALCAHRLEPKRLQLVKHEPGGAPWLALVDARLGCGVGLDILPDKIVPKKQQPAQKEEE